MKHRILGKSDIRVSALGLGCMGMSGGIYGKPDEAASLKTLHRAFELGINFFDTADMYGAGHNESFVGAFLKPLRNEVIISTKCGIVFEGDGIARNGSKAYIKQACEASLKRLGIEAIDLYFLHRMDPLVAIEDSMEAMRELLAEGKIRSVGVSEVEADIIKRAHTIVPITAVQSEYSILFRKAAEAVLPTCRDLGIAFVPFSPIGRGFLTGVIQSTDWMASDDFRRSLPFLQEGNITHNFELVQALSSIAKQQNRTPAQIALAWLLAQDPQIIPIPGTTRMEHLEENIQAVDIELSSHEIAQLGAVCHEAAVKGGRFPDALQGWFVK
ncbi:MAG TPA: aldo/keto reductase [Opitutales bacterium]|nr:aldo/keto reductase [Opitutales bacterium]